MADIKPVQLPVPSWMTEQGTVIAQWANVSSSDVCLPVDLAGHTDRSIQVTGTLDGATVSAQGTNDAALAYAPLTDPQGNDISIASYPSGYTSKIEAVSEATRLFRPAVTGGTAPLVTITLLARR